MLCQKFLARQRAHSDQLFAGDLLLATIQTEANAKQGTLNGEEDWLHLTLEYMAVATLVIEFLLLSLARAAESELPSPVWLAQTDSQSRLILCRTKAPPTRSCARSNQLAVEL
jgi:hypothetical protein